MGVFGFLFSGDVSVEERAMRWYVLIVFAALVESTNSMAAGPAKPGDEKQSPSLQETTEWLREKLSVYSGGEVEMSPKFKHEERYRDFSFDGCSFSYTYTFHPKIRGVPMMETKEVRMSLSDLDQGLVETTPRDSQVKIRGVTLRTAGGEEKISMKVIASSHGLKSSKAASHGITILDDDMSERIASAFRHAIGLCKARKEAF